MMNPRVCTIKHNPPHSYGDCIRACIGTMLDRDDVPHVFDARPPEQAWVALRAWLATIKKSLFIFPAEDDPREWMKENNPDVPYFLMCSSGGEDHMVIYINDKLYHNPSWYHYAIDGPLKNGFWVIGIIGILP